MREFLIALTLCISLTACGARPITGGTKGMLRCPHGPLSDIQVTLHQVAGDSAQPIGFGVTAADGSFELVQNEARGPLVLPPGEYRCTLENAGAPVSIPTEYSRAETTPLKVTWPGSMEIEAPITLTQ